MRMDEGKTILILKEMPKKETILFTESSYVREKCKSAC